MICGKSRIKNPRHRVQQEFHCSCSARNETLVIIGSNIYLYDDLDLSTFTLAIFNVSK